MHGSCFLLAFTAWGRPCNISAVLLREQMRSVHSSLSILIIIMMIVDDHSNDGDYGDWNDSDVYWVRTQYNIKG